MYRVQCELNHVITWLIIAFDLVSKPLRAPCLSYAAHCVTAIVFVQVFVLDVRHDVESEL